MGQEQLNPRIGHHEYLNNEEDEIYRRNAMFLNLLVPVVWIDGSSRQKHLVNRQMRI